MELLLALLKLLNSKGKEELREACAAGSGLHHRLLLYLLDEPAAGKEQLIRRLRTTANTYNKTCTIAKDLLWNHLESNAETPFDGVYILQQLLFRGDIKSGMKVYSALEKELEQKQAWTVLDALYIEGFRICHITGDLKMIEEVSEKRAANAQRTLTYVSLYGDIMVEMVRLESFRTRRTDKSKYFQYLRSLYERAKKVDHYILIYNTLHLLYMFSVRHRNDPSEVHAIVKQMLANEERFRNSMNAITRAAVQSSYVNFLTVYAGYGEPGPYVKKLLSEIESGGSWAKANLCYAMLEYSLYTNQRDGLREWMSELEQTGDTSKFAQYKYVILAIKSFIEKDHAGFRKNLALFYESPSHLDFPDMVITLRLQEIIMLLEEKQHRLLEPKLTSLRIYIERNLSRERYEAERKILYALRRLALNNDSKVMEKLLKEITGSPYRNIRSLAVQMSGLLQDMQQTRKRITA